VRLKAGDTTVHVFGLDAGEVARVARSVKFATRLGVVALIIGIIAGLVAIAANLPKIIEIARGLLGWA
jgi:hypothetical protein